MSDYDKRKVLRIPISEDDKNAILKKYNIDDIYDLEYIDTLEDKFSYGEICNFNIAPTERLFLDYNLETSYGNECGDWGRNRALTDIEREKYAPMFLEIYDGFNPEDIRLVEFCWYNCSEAPDYYDEGSTPDNFYDEV